MEHVFTFDEAAALLPEARRRIRDVAEQMARLQQLAQTLADGGDGPEGAIADAKGLEASIDEGLSWFRMRGVQVKGVAPALLDFPARAVRDGQALDVLLCWREGEDAITHYHPPETGYLGREPIADLDRV